MNPAVPVLTAGDKRNVNDFRKVRRPHSEGLLDVIGPRSPYNPRLISSWCSFLIIDSYRDFIPPPQIDLPGSLSSQGHKTGFPCIYAKFMPVTVKPKESAQTRHPDFFARLSGQLFHKKSSNCFISLAIVSFVFQLIFPRNLLQRVVRLMPSLLAASVLFPRTSVRTDFIFSKLSVWVFSST